ncbi:MAG: T9SS type A sorting domain-containing protein [Cyclobacteriaceae bacterium]
MRFWVVIAFWGLCSLNVFAQDLMLLNKQANTYNSGLSDVVKIPIQIKNTSDHPQFYIIRKTQGDLGGTQKGYFCIDNDCLEAGMDEFSKRIEPGETLTGLHYTLETGLMTGQTNFKFEVFVRGNPAELVEHAVSVSIEEKRESALVFQSKDITIHDVYPNPVSDYAFIEYRLINDSKKAKVVIHNILGRAMGDYELPPFETRIKLYTEDLAPGIYFYTLYLDNDGVLTRKLIVRK